jgi:hypothetical protein
MKRLGINQQAIKLFNDVFGQPEHQETIHTFGNFKLFYAKRKVPNFKTDEIVVKGYVYIKVIESNVKHDFTGFVDDFTVPLRYMQKEVKNFREEFMVYARYLSLSKSLSDKSTSKIKHKL